jgi:chromosome segregation ATPase
MPPSHSQPSDGARNNLDSEAQGEQTASPPMNGLRTLCGAINTLKEDASYQELANFLKEVETLRMELESKETTIKQLELSKETDRKNFEFTNESLINEHHKHYTKLADHRERLANEATAMRESIQKKDDSQKVLEDQQAQMQDEVAKLKEDLNSSNAFGREERQKYLKLERDFNAAKDEIHQLKANFKYREGEINQLKETKLSLEKRHNDMRQSLQSSNEELERIRGLAVKLRAESLTTT